MPSGPRIRGNNSFGFITDNPLTIGATTMNSAGLATLPVVASAHAVITLDPLRQFGAPEIVIVTVHTAAATTATITRGAYGTTARSHPVNTVWTHAPVTEDVIPILTSGTRPSDPYRGESIFETDTNRFVARSTADVWQQNGLFFDPPACRVFNSGTQPVGDATNLNPVLFDTEAYDTDNMHSTVSLTGRITFNTAGIYVVGALVEFQNATDYVTTLIDIQLPTGVRITGATCGDSDDGTVLSCETTYKFAVGDYVVLRAFQNNTGGASRNIIGSATGGNAFWATWIGRGN